MSKSNSRILITGPSGSGKETCARFIHSISNRMNHPFVVAACASLSNQMVDQLLFGFNDSKSKNILKVYLNKQIMVQYILTKFVTFLLTLKLN